MARGKYETILPCSAVTLRNYVGRPVTAELRPQAIFIQSTLTPEALIGAVHLSISQILRRRLVVGHDPSHTGIPVRSCL
jgi:hypothetical protein